MISAAQLKAIHAEKNRYAKHAAMHGVDFDDAHWRLILRNMGRVEPDEGGHVSAKNLSQSGFDSVMAYLCALSGKPARPDNSRVTWMIEQLYGKYSKLDNEPMELLGIVYQATGLRVQRVGELPITSGRKVIEALKSILRRTASHEPPRTDAGQEITHGSDAQSDD